MWAWRLDGFRQLVRTEIEAPDADRIPPGHVIVRLRVGGICGSDIPKCTGAATPLPPDQPGPGFPLHEVMGEIVAARDSRWQVGQRIVAMARDATGLRELSVIPDERVVAVPDDLPDHIAVVAQPAATVFSALRKVAPVQGRSAAIIGLGSTGMLAVHILATAGATPVWGVDPVDRTETAEAFGVTKLLTAQIEAVADTLPRVGVCFEAVGHNTSTLVSAGLKVDVDGDLVAFGVPDDEQVTLPFRELFRANVTMHLGTTLDWSHFLARGMAHVVEHADVMSRLVTHRVDIADVPKAYELASHAEPGRLKVVVEV